MKALKIIIAFVLILAGVFSAFYFSTRVPSNKITPPQDERFEDMRKQIENENCVKQEVVEKQECSRCLRKVSNLEQHQLTCEKFACEKCGPNVWFHTPEDLNNHMRSKHSGGRRGANGTSSSTPQPKEVVKKHECPYCGPSMWFCTKDELERHLKTCKNKPANSNKGKNKKSNKESGVERSIPER